MSQGDESTQKPDTGTAPADAQSLIQPNQQPQQQPAQQPQQKDPWNKFTFKPRGSLGLEINIQHEIVEELSKAPEAQDKN